MNKKTMTTVTMTPDGKTKKTIVEYNDGIKTERVFIDGVEQKKFKAEVAPNTFKAEVAPKKEQKEYVIQTPFGPMTITKSEMESIKDRMQKAQEEAERQAKELEAMKKAAEEQKKKLEEQKQRIKEATEKKIEKEVQAFKKAREQRGRFLVRFFLEGRETRIAEKRFMRAEDIYRPHLGDYVYLGNWLVEEDGVADEYWDTRFVVDDVTYCMEEDAEGTVLIDIDVSILNDWPEDEIMTYNTRW